MACVPLIASFNSLSRNTVTFRRQWCIPFFGDIHVKAETETRPAAAILVASCGDCHSSSRADVGRILRVPLMWAKTGRGYKRLGTPPRHCPKPQQLGHLS